MERRDDQPLYLRIQSHIRHGIVSGRYRPGDRLPSENELAATFETTRATVAHALEKLVFERFLVRRPGSGTFVAETTSALLPAEPTRPDSASSPANVEGRLFRVLVFEPLPDAPERAAARDGVPPGGSYRLERIQMVVDEAVGWETALIPAEIAVRLGTGQLERHGMADLLLGLGLPAARQDGIIRVDTADAQLALRLGIARGSAILMRDYHIADTEGRVLIQGTMRYRPNQLLQYEIHS